GAGVDGAGLRPRPAMSRSLRVTRVRAGVIAVAAGRPSMAGIGPMALMRPQWSETALSMPSTRPPNAASTCRSHRSSAAALSGSVAHVPAKWNPVRQGEPLFADKDMRQHCKARKLDPLADFPENECAQVQI